MVEQAIYQSEVDDIETRLLESLLRHDTNWHNLRKWTARYSKEFLEELWPWFVCLVRHVVEAPDDSKESYADWLGLALEFDPSTERESRFPVPSAIQAAVIGYAVQAPDKFLEFVRKNQDIAFMPVHMLLAQGLEKLASAHPTVCLSYLLGDPRRLALGPYSYSQRDSIALISTMYPHLDTAQQAELDAAILGFNYNKLDRSDADAETRLSHFRWNRRRRLRLLRAIPSELMSQSTRRAFDELNRAFPQTSDKDIELTGFGAISSPMSDKQMEKADDEYVVRLFDELHDDTEWDHPRRRHLGGSVEASREFAKLAKKDPQRALLIIREFKPGTNERPVGYALGGLSESGNFTPEELVELIHELDGRGFTSVEFRAEAARCLRAAAHSMKGLPDQTCSLLSGWLTSWKATELPKLVDIKKGASHTTSNEDDREESVIWGAAEMKIIPGGNYPVLDAIERGYLCRIPKAVDSWLDILECHLDRIENPDVWRALAHDFKYLESDDPRRASAFLKRLFAEVPSVIQSREGMGLLANIRWWLPRATFWPELTTLLTKSKWDNAAQAAGEVLFLYWSLCPENEDYQRLIDDVIFGRESGYITSPERLRYLRLGVAASAAYVWETQYARELASQTLDRLLPLKDEAVSDMVMDVFQATERLPQDEHTERLLQALPHHSECFRHGSYSLINHLKDLLARGLYVEEVCAITEMIVTVAGEEIGDMRTHWAGEAKDLVEIAHTLQRFEETRERGLTLIENLMGVETYFLPKLLQEIDRRIGD